MAELRRHLVVMVRAPRLGTVKRRLARDVGDLAALRFYRGHTAGLLGELACDPRWIAWLAVTPDAAARDPRGLWRFDGPVLAQGEGDLGRRMGHILSTLPPGPAVIVGSDVPGITRRRAWRAFQALGAHDWVFGPAEDGGYGLVGARRRPALRLPFSGVRWSTPDALADTLANLPDGKVAFVERLGDVDRGADFRRLYAAASSRTAR